MNENSLSPALRLKNANTNKELLEIFLSTPLSSSESIFKIFSDLPNSVEGVGDLPKQHYVYIPGTDKNRILLVAHADTVWDSHYTKNPHIPSSVIFENGVFKSADKTFGIGADDRAGCAILWALRNSGHSLLLVDGEEHGKIGARFLRKSNPKLFSEINNHAFLIELDTRGTNLCLLNQVDYTEDFASYIKQNLNLTHDTIKGGCDLQILCHKVCGVNIGIGYYNYHSPAEFLNLEDFENTYNRLLEFLSTPHPRFPISKKKRFIKHLNFLVRLPIRILRKLAKLFRNH